MTEGQTRSWIFLATAMASQAEPADYDSISNIADGINRAVPTHKEIQTSLTWLTKNDLVFKREQISADGERTSWLWNRITTNLYSLENLGQPWDSLKEVRDLRPSAQQCVPWIILPYNADSNLAFPAFNTHFLFVFLSMHLTKAWAGCQGWTRNEPAANGVFIHLALDMLIKSFVSLEKENQKLPCFH